MEGENGSLQIFFDYLSSTIHKISPRIFSHDTSDEDSEKRRDDSFHHHHSKRSNNFVNNQKHDGSSFIYGTSIQNMKNVSNPNDLNYSDSKQCNSSNPKTCQKFVGWSKYYQNVLISTILVVIAICAILIYFVKRMAMNDILNEEFT
ncbi:hypothetical protein RF11_00884 [Thelohanellus kitauei]|uniref:Uncharacterized protein n=1 Tax=Thelohanellus kitauei TaxID=669202 RepID=A0A0C2MFZ8_THEKT|nr:hypothetical protein RF11_00884 [Thelohanellus kitauei]